MGIAKITQVSMTCLPSEAKFPALCYHCGRPTKNIIKYNYPLYYRRLLSDRLGPFYLALFIWGAVAYLFTIRGLSQGLNFFTVMVVNFIILCIFMAIAMISYDHDSEKFLQPNEYVALSMPVCSACTDSTISRKKLVRMAFGGSGLILLSFIILLFAELDFNLFAASTALLSFILGVVLFIRAFKYSKGLRSLTIWKYENRYLWIIRNPKFAKEFALLNGFKIGNAT